MLARPHVVACTCRGLGRAERGCSLGLSIAAFRCWIGYSAVGLESVLKRKMNIREKRLTYFLNILRDFGRLKEELGCCCFVRNILKNC